MVSVMFLMWLCVKGKRWERVKSPDLGCHFSVCVIWTSYLCLSTRWRTSTAGSGILTVSIDNPTARTQPEWVSVSLPLATWSLICSKRLCSVFFFNYYISSVTFLTEHPPPGLFIPQLLVLFLSKGKQWRRKSQKEFLYSLTSTVLANR